jgi:hypothetical protein
MYYYHYAPAMGPLDIVERNQIYSMFQRKVQWQFQSQHVLNRRYNEKRRHQPIQAMSRRDVSIYMSHMVLCPTGGLKDPSMKLKKK